MALLGLLPFLALGCARTHFMSFSMLARNSFAQSRMADFQRGEEAVEGSDSSSIVVIVPLGAADIERAFDDAVAKVPGCVALMDGSIGGEFGGFPFLYMRNTVIVRGVPLIDPELAAAAKQAR